MTIVVKTLGQIAHEAYVEYQFGGCIPEGFEFQEMRDDERAAWQDAADAVAQVVRVQEFEGFS